MPQCIRSYWCGCVIRLSFLVSLLAALQGVLCNDFSKRLLFLPRQTAFVRQKTPHPKELKAKAHKLFGGGKKDDPDTGGDAFSQVQPVEQQPEVMFNNHVVTTSTPQTSAVPLPADQEQQRISFEAPQSFEDDDDEEVSHLHN